MSNHKGMTLIEVMVALVIFAVAALSITNSLGQLMSNMPILQERTYAQWVADNVLVDAKLENEKQFLATGKKEGDTEMAGQRWYWRREVVKTQSDDFHMIRVSVSNDSRYQRILTQVNTYVFKVK
ncbi:type II secretion system minor pseudopilin GspI [Parashewanella tropica]|uniref:type II secretion system minor pseudopilin GspI n=1 Tax=Parashewanella tropica TaxID=2547970 RepID=UPI00105A6DE7|nr:type II secretion system minor pseudopilin GspI [Parashewanella tropica]